MSDMFGKSLRGCSAVVLFACLATSVHAQCSHRTIGFSEIGVVSNNPFLAERVTTSVTLAADGTKRVTTLMEYVARDSSGRVRVESLLQPLSPNATETEIAAIRRQIIICDAAAGTHTQIDTLFKTVKIIEDSDPAPANPARHSWSAPFFPTPASKLPSNIQFEDLGWKTIEGVEAHGGRFTTPVRVDERWSSDDLAADVLQVHSDPRKGSETRIALTRVRRTEPEPSLFAIPAGYSVSKVAAGVNRQ
jgi:hypothetical protein